MIDNISFWNYDLEGELLLENLIEQKRIYSNKTQEESIHYSLGNMQTVKQGKRIVVSGSLCKYINGNNYENWSIEEAIAGLKQLEIDLGTPIDRAGITRLDVSLNLGLDEEVKNYLTGLKELSRFEAIPYRYNGKEYFQGKAKNKAKSKMLLLYDKLEELKQDKQAIPNGLSKNLLRIEYRLQRQIKQKLGTDNSIGNIKNILQQATKQFEEKFLSIERANLMKLRSDVISINRKEAKEKIIIDTIKEKGIEAVLQPFTQLLTPCNLSRLKKDLSKLSQDTNILEANPIMQELETKFIETINQLKGESNEG